MRILDKALYGSRLYGTATKDSDWDYICVVDKYPEEGSDIIDGDKTYHLYTIEDHNKAMLSHDVAVIEAMYLNNKVPEFFRLDKGKLRESFSTVSNHSWVKGKKKLTVHFDYDKYLALKSIFHSIRITDYGIQLAEQGRIYQKDRYNYVLEELLKLGELHERDELWEVVESRYKKLWKDLRHQFKTVCPKSNMEGFDRKQMLIDVLRKNDVKSTKKLIKEITEIFE